MATDRQGRPITQEQVDGLERFNQNDVPRKLCYTPSSVLAFDLDEAYVTEHEEDAHIYFQLLPTQIRDLLFIPAVGEIISCAKQYAGEIVNKRTLLKQFRVVSVEKEIDQDTTRLCLFITVNVVPVEP